MNTRNNKKFSENKLVKWIPFYLYSNCFDDGEKTHLAFLYNGEYYCLTHSVSSLKVDEKFCRMKRNDTRDMYLTKAKSKPKKLHITGATISKIFFLNNLKLIV
jgi:hypothetical protein